MRTILIDVWGEGPCRTCCGLQNLGSLVGGVASSVSQIAPRGALVTKSCCTACVIQGRKGLVIARRENGLAEDFKFRF